MTITKNQVQTHLNYFKKMLIRIKCTHYADLGKQRISYIYLPLKPFCGFNVFLSGSFYLENSE